MLSSIVKFGTVEPASIVFYTCENKETIIQVRIFLFSKGSSVTGIKENIEQISSAHSGKQPLSTALKRSQSLLNYQSQSY